MGLLSRILGNRTERHETNQPIRTGRARGGQHTPTARPPFSPRQRYDAVAPGAGKLRRTPVIELTGETGAKSAQLPPMQRLRMYALCRDAVRNYSAAKSILRQMTNNVIGTQFKLTLKVEGDAARRAEDWFNLRFAKNCYFRSDMHLADFCRLLLARVIVDGDCALAFDRTLLGTGKLIAYEGDRICDPNPLPDYAAESNDGVLLDKYGREIGYFTAGAIGRTVAPLGEGTVWRRDPDDPEAADFRLLRMPWRFDQFRGISEMAAGVSDLLDTYEMRAKELQSAKVAATFAGIVKRKDNGAGSDIASDPRYDPIVAGSDGSANQGDGDAQSAEAPKPNYQRLETLVGGMMEYLDDGDDFEMLDPKSRPNINADEFSQRVVKSAAAGMGLAACYAMLEAQSSYTAARAEMVMSWVTFRHWQKWYERNIQDWIGRKAVTFAMASGAVPELPEGWADRMVWSHPRMPYVDPQKDQAALTAALRNGAASLESELGPEWRGIADEIAAEAEHYRELGIPFPTLLDNNGMPIISTDE